MNAAENNTISCYLTPMRKMDMVIDIYDTTNVKCLFFDSMNFCINIL